MVRLCIVPCIFDFHDFAYEKNEVTPSPPATIDCFTIEPTFLEISNVFCFCVYKLSYIHRDRPQPVLHTSLRTYKNGLE